MGSQDPPPVSVDRYLKAGVEYVQFAFCGVEISGSNHEYSRSREQAAFRD